MADPFEETIHTYDAYASVYAEINASHKPVAYLYDIFVEYGAAGRLLDVGCGHGRDTGHFARRGFQATGVDRSQGLLHIAQEHAPGARFCQGDMRRLPFGAASFDALWVCASMLHLPKADAPDALAEFRRVMAPGGILYVGVKNGTGETLVASETFGRAERFFAYYSAPELAGLIRAAGFRMLENTVRNGWVNLFAKA